MSGMDRDRAAPPAGAPDRTEDPSSVRCGSVRRLDAGGPAGPDGRGVRSGRPTGLRDARPADRAALIDLWVLAWRAALPEIDFEARRPWLDAHLDALLAAGARLLVAEAGVTIAGFATVDPARRHMDQLAVHPAHQGSGIADRLMAGAKALSPGGLSLDVNAGNARARRFYARHGFAEVSSGTNPRSGLPTRLLQWGHDAAEKASPRGD